MNLGSDILVMLADLTISDRLSLLGDTKQDWGLFKQKFQLNSLAADLREKPDEVHVPLLLTL